jgi:hypothetical protein
MVGDIISDWQVASSRNHGAVPPEPALQGHAPFQLEHRTEGRERQVFQVCLLSGEASLTTWAPRIGNRIRPIPQLSVQLVESGEEEILAECSDLPHR